ncbi:MAG: phage tail sheath family protein [Boseongicola sp.]
MSRYYRPGAYYERIDRAGQDAVSLRTDIACFVGIAEQGPLDTPVPVESFRQFQSHFGSYTGAGYLAYSIKAFFENGGDRAWIIRVASRREDLGARASGFDLGEWQISAASPGAWGDALEIRITRESQIETSAEAALSSQTRLKAASVAGFSRYDLVEVSQPGEPEQHAVVAEVDSSLGELVLATDDPNFPYKFQSITLLPDLPARVGRVTYALDIYRDRRFQSRASGVSQVRENDAFAARVLAGPNYELAARTGAPIGVPPLVVVSSSIGQGVVPAPLPLPTEHVPLTGGFDGLSALSVKDFTGEEFNLRDNVGEAFGNLRGVRAMEFVDEISVAAVPDILIRPQPDPIREPDTPPPNNPCLTCPPPREPVQPASSKGFKDLPPVFSDEDVFRVQSALIRHCEDRGDRFAVIDPPFQASRDNAESLSDAISWRNRFDSSHAALYFPWARVFEPRGTDVVRDVPPSGHVLGKYAYHDLQTGVHRAPANSRLAWIQDLTLTTNFAMDEILNDQSVNVLRQEPGRHIRIMGARTLSSEPNARYVNIRRLILLIRRAANVLSQWVVFEPNSAVTRTKYTSVLQNFLGGLFARGAFAGGSPEESFFVKCDEENNPSSERGNGRLLAEIGVAPAFPLEFVVMRVGRQGNELKIDEAASVARASL